MKDSKWNRIIGQVSLQVGLAILFDYATDMKYMQVLITSVMIALGITLLTNKQN